MHWTIFECQILNLSRKRSKLYELRIVNFYKLNIWNSLNILNLSLDKNVIEKKLVCEDCYMTKLTFFESEVTLHVEIDHIVT